jgi:hypothetical protein
MWVMRLDRVPWDDIDYYCHAVITTFIVTIAIIIPAAAVVAACDEGRRRG